jgi:ribosomal protein L3 glutamine methyltransferase
MAALPAEYRHELRVALAGGADGLAFVARVLAAAPTHLEADGLLLCEVGDARRTVERRFARLQLGWPKAEVFSFQPAKTATARRRPASRAAGGR